MIESDCAKFNEEKFIINYLKRRINMIDMTWIYSALQNVEQVY